MFLEKGSTSSTPTFIVGLTQLTFLRGYFCSNRCFNCASLVLNSIPDSGCVKGFGYRLVLRRLRNHFYTFSLNFATSLDCTGVRALLHVVAGCQAYAKGMQTIEATLTTEFGLPLRETSSWTPIVLQKTRFVLSLCSAIVATKMFWHPSFPQILNHGALASFGTYNVWSHGMSTFWAMSKRCASRSRPQNTRTALWMFACKPSIKDAFNPPLRTVSYISNDFYFQYI